MEYEKSIEKKLKTYKRKKLEYEMLEDTMIDDEVFKKNSVQEIIEALKTKVDDKPYYSFSDFTLQMQTVSEAESFYGIDKDKADRFLNRANKAVEGEKNQIDKALQEYLKQPGEKLCDFMVKKQIELNRFGSEIYKPVLMTKQTYSKLISNQTKEPSFETCVQLMFTYKSDITEANKILQLVGKAFSDSEYHRTVKYFIEHKQYDINDLNDTLLKLNYDVIGCK